MISHSIHIYSYYYALLYGNIEFLHVWCLITNYIYHNTVILFSNVQLKFYMLAKKAMRDVKYSEALWGDETHNDVAVTLNTVHKYRPIPHSPHHHIMNKKSPQARIIISPPPPRLHPPHPIVPTPKHSPAHSAHLLPLNSSYPSNEHSYDSPR